MIVDPVPGVRQLVANRYLNMIDLREHRRERLRMAA